MLYIFSGQDLSGWVCSRSEVEVVDMVLRLRSKLPRAATLPPSHPARDKLTQHLHTLFMALPEDLRAVLHAS